MIVNLVSNGAGVLVADGVQGTSAEELRQEAVEVIDSTAAGTVYICEWS